MNHPPRIPVMPDLPLLRLADVSTVHVPPSDLEFLKNPGAPGVAMCHHYGALIYMPEADDDDTFAEWRAFGWSEAFIMLVRIAFNQDFNYLYLSADGQVIPGLKQFEH